MERITQTRQPIIGSNIERLCKENKLRYIDVIAQLNVRGIDYVTTGIFSKVIHGHNNPSVEMLIALTEIFNCDFNEFFKEVKEK
jgi:transcriptional regulator with XRE-family HTH domain